MFQDVVFPWRSVSIAWAVTIGALIAGVPIFLRMPPWCDLTLYDIAAWNLLTGGVHYRDVFDTNLPGFVWALAGVRAVLGWSYEALRLVDLLIVAGIMILLERLAKRGGASRANRAWMFAGAALFYPFTTEFVHAQRDVWMLLPAVAAVLIRVKAMTREPMPERPRIAYFWPGVWQGVFWGCAVWIKPHVVFPAALVWIITANRCLAQSGWRGVLADFSGNVVGGLVIGVAGLMQLVLSGTWPHFVEVFTFWNQGYAKQMWSELNERYDVQLHYFPPWSYLPLLALPLAFLDLVTAWQRRGDEPGRIERRLPQWLWDRGADANTRFVRLTVSALYLGWTMQALYVQRQFHYVHVPEILILFAVLALHRWSGVFFIFAWLLVTGCLTNLLIVPKEEPDSIAIVGQKYRWALRHPLMNPDWIDRWPTCWRMNLDPIAYRQRMTEMRRIKDFHGSNDFTELGEVADWLTAHGVKDGDLICWHDAPHALYIVLQIRPGYRFQHVSQMMGIGMDQKDQMVQELSEALPKVKYVISDLMRAGAENPGRPAGWWDLTPDLLPPDMDKRLRDHFPYTIPAVFRSGGGRGRYIIHVLQPDMVPIEQERLKQNQ